MDKRKYNSKLRKGYLKRNRGKFAGKKEGYILTVKKENEIQRWREKEDKEKWGKEQKETRRTEHRRKKEKKERKKERKKPVVMKRKKERKKERS